MSTPPLSRSDSRGQIDNTGESEKGNKPPVSTTSTPPKPPVMHQGQPSASRLRLALGSVPTDTAGFASSAPILSSQRLAKAAPTAPTAPTPPTGAAAPGSSSSATSTSKTPAAHDKGNVGGDQIPEKLANALRAGFNGWKDVPKRTDPNVMVRVPVFNLPPKQIARLLVGMESNFYKEPLNGLKVREPLRNKFEIRNFKLNDLTTIPKINVIDDILMPFVVKSFEDADSESARQAVKSAFEAFASGPYKNLLLEKNTEKSEKASAVQKNLVFRTHFDPVIKPFLNYLQGEECGFDSSKLPEKFKSYIAEIDACYAEWSAGQGGDTPASSSKTSPSGEQGKGFAPHLAARKNALIGAMLTRGLLLAWQQKFMAESHNPGAEETPIGKHFMLLMTHLGHYATFGLDAFLIDIMGRHGELPTTLQAEFGNLATGAKLKKAEDIASKRKANNERRKLERSQTDLRKLESSQTVSDSPRKTGIAGFIGSMLSPRREEEKMKPVTPVSPRGNRTRPTVSSTEGILLKNAEARITASRLKHRKEIKDYLKSIQLPAFDLGYVAFLNKAVERRKNFETFEIAPAAFCLMQLKDYVKQLEATQQPVPTTIEKIAAHLNALVRTEREEIDKVESHPVSGDSSSGVQGRGMPPGMPPSSTAAIASPASGTNTNTIISTSTSATAVPSGASSTAPASPLTLDLSQLRSPFEEDEEQSASPVPSAPRSAEAEATEATNNEDANADNVNERRSDQ